MYELREAAPAFGAATVCDEQSGSKPLSCRREASLNCNKIFAARERKERRDKDLCFFLFAIFALFCG